MTFTKAARLVLLLAIPGLVLVGCGRKGDLDRPGSTAPINTKAPAGTVEQQEKPDERPFLLDPLL
ncbi:LPS translocon maturation chaperone LptM [Ensifer sp.]|jgi:predicted small lipoprotein YifL|uniref:LPS translocon maturation chaperone LptM n=1 Tax=Ensifer sp. TaxID=1872086 RepID=UPI002E126525|nr:lipoprotein [Ensifer sp.]